MSKSTKKCTKRVSRCVRRAAKPSSRTTGEPTEQEDRSWLQASARDRDAAVVSRHDHRGDDEGNRWQQHSVRGFLAGVVRKKLNLKLESKKVDGQRVYRIDERAVGRGKPASRSKRRAA